MPKLRDTQTGVTVTVSEGRAESLAPRFVPVAPEVPDAPVEPEVTPRRSRTRKTEE